MSSKGFGNDYDWLLGPKRFDVLFDLAERSDRTWDHSDLGELLQAQLNLPMPETTSGHPDAPSKANMRALLFDAETPLSSLKSINDWAKAWSRDADGPRDVAFVIYLSAIAAALVHHGRSTTRQSPQLLSQQFTWALAQQWVDPELRKLLRRAVRANRMGETIT